MGDDYRYHIEVEAKRRFLELLKERFNAGVKYKDKTWKWDTMILNKAQELARLLLRESQTIDFCESPQRLIESNRIAFERSSPYDLRRHASSEKPFKPYGRTLKGLIYPS